MQRYDNETNTRVNSTETEHQSHETENNEILEWIFWMIILSITGIGMIYCCFKCTQKVKHWLGKWKDARNSAAEDREFEQIRMRVISTLELAGYGNEDEL